MALDSVRGSLKDKGVRLTRQRQTLLELIDRSGQHLDAENLFQMAKEKDPKLNRVTVYRTLKLLKEGGLVDELDLMHYGGDQHYYETRTKQEHAHVICLRCGKVEEFFGEPLQRLRRQIESHFAFQILLARTEVGGYCSHCQSLRSREMEQAAREAAAQQALVEPDGLGHQADSHLILRDSRASRNHAQIVLVNGEYAVEDLSSRHGVYVNGQRVERQRLRNSDRIEFGVPDSYQLVFA